MDIDNFYIPNDKPTTRYEKAVEKLEHLPASICLQEIIHIVKERQI